MTLKERALAGVLGGIAATLVLSGLREAFTRFGLVCSDPPGKLVTEPGGGLHAEDETKAAYWTLDTLAEAAQQMGIEVGRSQVKRILLAEGVRWRNTRPWTESAGPEFVPKGLMDRRTLHQPIAQLRGGLRRRARSHHPWALPSGSGIVAGWAPHL